MSREPVDCPLCKGKGKVEESNRIYEVGLRDSEINAVIAGWIILQQRDNKEHIRFIDKFGEVMTSLCQMLADNQTGE
jgi:hypothetical protein